MSCPSRCTIPYTILSCSIRSWTYGNLNIIEIKRARFLLASTLILSQYSRQLNAMSMMSWLSSKCWDFSFVNMTIKDLIRASLSSLFDYANSDCCDCGRNELPDLIPWLDAGSRSRFEVADFTSLTDFKVATRLCASASEFCTCFIEIDFLGSDLLSELFWFKFFLSCA